MGSYLQRKLKKNEDVLRVSNVDATSTMEAQKFGGSIAEYLEWTSTLCSFSLSRKMRLELI
jgi:hypothetical protein